MNAPTLAERLSEAVRAHQEQRDVEEFELVEELELDLGLPPNRGVRVDES